MESIDALSPSVCRGIRCLLADIDDTMTTGGKLPAASYQGLWDLHDAGIAVIPVTGRPAGWCDLICRQWPVDGVIGENGAFAFCMDGHRRRTLLHPLAPDPEANRARLAALAERVYASVPGTRAAKDQFSRLFDIAVDFREEPPLLDFAAADRIRAIFEQGGATAKISSIHVNAWFGDYDKLSMSRIFLQERFGLDVADPQDNARVLFCGDSPNDEPMFSAFRWTVGVANIAPFLPGMAHPPAFTTPYESAEGFACLVRAILQARNPGTDPIPCSTLDSR